jgi:hypothetical protein
MYSKNESGKARLRYLSFALDAPPQSHPYIEFASAAGRRELVNVG